MRLLSFKVFTLIIIFAFGLVFTACESNPVKGDNEILRVKDLIEIPSEVSSDITLPSQIPGYNVDITWSSDHPDIISNSGEFTQPDESTTVVLTATLTKDEITDTATFNTTAIGANTD